MGEIMGSIPTLLYFGLTFPLYFLWIALLSHVIFGKQSLKFILPWSLFAGMMSTFFSVLGELIFGLLLAGYLTHTHRKSDMFWVFVMMECNLIIINIGSIILDLGQHWYPKSALTILIVVRVAIMLSLFGLALWLPLKRNLWIKKLYDSVNHSAVFWKTGLIDMGLVCFALYIFEFIFTVLEVNPLTELFVLGVFVLSILLNALSLIFSLRAYRNQTELHWIKKAGAAREEYYTNLEIQQTRNRQILHDYKNVLASIQFSLNHATVPAVSSDTDTLISQAQDQLVDQQPDTASISAIACAPLRSLIYLKWTAALNQGIKMNLATEGKHLLATQKDVLTIVRIVGILLDNALEATVANHQKQLTLLISENSDQSVEITIINAVPKTFKLGLLNQSGYTTKGKGHGNGLAIVNQLIANHQGLNLRKHLSNNELEISLFIEDPTNA